jgi:hypothetical protein
MRSKFLAHLRRQWMGALALFLVLTGGTAYAANTVFSEDIVNGEVKNPDLAANAVTTGKIANGGVGLGDLAADSVNGGKVVNNSLTGADVVESSLNGVFKTAPGKKATVDQASFAAGECQFGCFTFLTNPTNGAPFLDGAFKLAGCTDSAMTLGYENQSGSTQVLRQVRYSGANGPAPSVVKTTFAAGDEEMAFFGTLEDSMRRIEVFVQGGGTGEASYDIYTEHQNATLPGFDDTCSAAGSVTSVFSG